jgi:hypothetical protein
MPRRLQDAVASLQGRGAVLPRAWEHAEALAARPTLVLRYTQLMFTGYLKKRMEDLLPWRLRRGAV